MKNLLSKNALTLCRQSIIKRFALLASMLFFVLFAASLVALWFGAVYCQQANPTCSSVYCSVPDELD